MKSKYSKALAFLTLALAAIVPQAFPATLTVTSLTDSGAGTLRNLIAVASPGETIQLALSGTITLNSELVISKDLRINGLTANSLRISGNNHSRVFNITSGTIQIFNMTIADGRVVGTNGPAGSNGERVSGGGILVANAATLDLENCILTRRTPATFRISFTTVAGKRYLVERTTNLLSWEVVTNNIQGTGANALVTDHVNSATAAYRVQLMR